MDERVTLPFEEKIFAFLKHHGWHEARSVALPCDASRRHYRRLQRNDATCLLMIDPPPTGQLPSFARISSMLVAKGLSAPRVYAQSFEEGLALVEDFGEGTFAQYFKMGHDKHTLYQLATDALVALRNSFPLSECEGLSPFTAGKHLDQLDIFCEWYYPAVFGHSMEAQDRADLKGLVAEAFEALTEHPDTMVLKDFHVDNLMLLAERSGVERCGLLDFQDAVIGPAAYDLVSLLQDSRLDMEKDLVHAIFTSYLKAFPEDDPVYFEACYHIIGAQRNIKNLGIFARLNWRDNKPRYLAFVPRLWENLEESLRHPHLRKLEQWFDLMLPPSCRVLLPEARYA